jgi:hypothetical protein
MDLYLILKLSMVSILLVGVSTSKLTWIDAFGDCYISGWIEGGEFNGIISMRVIDRSKTNSVTASIRKSSSTGTPNEFNFNMDSFDQGNSSTSTDALNETETTISVSWMGGGQIKDPDTPWDMQAVFGAAAGFPARVATW